MAPLFFSALMFFCPARRHGLGKRPVFLTVSCTGGIIKQVDVRLYTGDGPPHKVDQSSSLCLIKLFVLNRQTLVSHQYRYNCCNVKFQLY